MDEDILIPIALLLVLSVSVLPIVTFVLQLKALRRLRELGEAVRSLRHEVRQEAQRGRDPVSPIPAAVPAKPAPAPTAAPPAVAAPRPPVAAPRLQEVPAVLPPQPKAAPAAPRPQTPPPAAPREPGRIEAAARELLRKTWSWIVVGEEHRPNGVSMEYAVATNWLVRLGVLILVCGVGFFLRYSMQHGWLGPLGRVTLSLLGGAAMLSAGVSLLGRRYHLLGQGLMGAGLATLYFAAFAAFSFYHLLDQMPAFGLMALVTVTAGVMAVRFDSLLVAVLGLVGGYGTPVMLSTGEANFVGLFSYVLLLGVGMLGIAYRRNWLLLNALSFLATYGLFWAAVDRHYQTTAFWQVTPFLGAFFVLFSTVGFLHNVVNRVRSTLVEVLILLLNAAVVFGAGYYLIDGAFGQRWVAALTVAMAAFYCLHVQVFLARQLTDRALVTACIGLASFFLVVTVPLVLSKQWITLSWSVEAFILLWMAGRLNSEFLRQCAYLLYALSLGRFLCLDLPHQFRNPVAAPSLAEYGVRLFERLISFGMPVASMAAAHRLLRQSPPAASAGLGAANNVRAWVRASATAQAFIVAFSLALFLYLHLEINHSLRALCPPVRMPALTLLWLAACAVTLIGCGPAAAFRWVLLWALLVAVFVKLWMFDMGLWQLRPLAMVCGSSYSGLEAGMRLLDFGAVLAFLAYGFRLVSARAAPAGMAPLLGYTSLALLFAYATIEVNTFLHFFVPGLRPGGVSVLWSCFALGFVLGGTLRGVRPLRFLGLFLFVVVAIKVFFSDLAHLNQLYRIVAFLALGVLLLAGSFVYLTFRQRFAVSKEETSP